MRVKERTMDGGVPAYVNRGEVRTKSGEQLSAWRCFGFNSELKFGFTFRRGPSRIRKLPCPFEDATKSAAAANRK